MSTVTRASSCPHRPPCPAPDAPDHDGARLLSAHPEQGWSLLCNRVVVFDDTGELLPDGRVIPPHRPAVRVVACAA
jgi:hypothetical protein